MIVEPCTTSIRVINGGTESPDVCRDSDETPYVDELDQTIELWSQRTGKRLTAETTRGRSSAKLSLVGESRCSGS